MDSAGLSATGVTGAFSRHTSSRLGGASGTELEVAFVQDQHWRQQRQQTCQAPEDYLEDTWNEELHELELKRQQLHRLAKEFHSRLPPDLKGDIAVAPSSFKDVTKVMERVKSRWKRRCEEEKFAKARQYFRKVGGTIDNHSNVLKVLPSQNDYASPLCGAITVLMKATSNYDRLAEGFARAMAEINDSITTVHQDVFDYRNEVEIQHLVIRLYCQIFSFLVNAMKWYTEKWHKRLMSSLNENLYGQYQEQVSEVQRLAELIHKRATIRKMADLKTAIVLSDDRLKFLLDLQDRDRKAAEMRQDGYFERLSIKVRNEYKDMIQDRQGAVQQSIVDSLVPEVSRFIAGAAISRHLEDSVAAGRRTSPSPLYDLLSDTRESDAEHDSCADKSGTYTRQQILLHSARLADYFDDTKIALYFPSTDAPAFLADARIVSRLYSATTSPSSEMLHICGPAELSEETQPARIAARYAAAAREAKVSVVSFFCSMGRAEPPAGRTRETIELVALAYALMRQLVELLPEDELGAQTFGEGFGARGFAALDGTLGTWSEALVLLDDLFAANDEPLLYVVIDGINQLDDVSHNSTTKPLRELVGLLKKHVSVAKGREKHVLKLLFTTAGQSAALNESLDARDVVATSPTPVRSIGRKPM